MVMGDSGIFSKANQAKNKTEVAQYEEELRMCVLEIQADEATNGTTFGIDTIRKNLVEKVKELENTEEIEITSPEGNATIEGTYKGYEYKIDEKYVVHIGDKATGIILTTSLEPEGWTNQNVKATITIKSNNGINKVEPDEGSKNGNNEYIITKENIAENTSFEYTVTDGQKNTQTKTVEINTIDKNAPADFTITAENTAEGLKITGETTDAESGIDKYEYYAKKSDGEYKAYDSNPITGLASGTYNVYAIAYDKAGNLKQSTNTVENVKISRTYSNITAQMVAEHPEIYYGLTVTNYESQNGQNDWKIFYSDWKENPDDAHIFLITGDYVENSKMKSDIYGIKLDDNYGVKWTQYKMQNITEETKKLFIMNECVLKDSYEGSQAVSVLLNTENWSNFKDDSKAKDAIGSPTLEMWTKSWNNLYEKYNEKLFCRKIEDDFGCYIGTTQDNTTRKIESSIMKSKKGFNNSLYYPYKYSSASWELGRSGYLVATVPNILNCVYCIDCDGEINSVTTNNGYGLRPVVSLKKDITVDAKDSE